MAIKLLKRGMDSEAVLERFQLERRVLDTLNHPNIALLLGGGVTPDGRSYFIMEFVEGHDLHAAIHSFRMISPEERWRRCDGVSGGACSRLLFDGIDE